MYLNLKLKLKTNLKVFQETSVLLTFFLDVAELSSTLMMAMVSPILITSLALYKISTISPETLDGTSESTLSVATSSNISSSSIVSPTFLNHVLQKDSNRTTKSIAEELGMTTSPIFERIKKLEKEGYIKKYVAVLDNKKIGLKLTVFIGITLQGHTRSYLEKFVKEINNFFRV